MYKNNLICVLYQILTLYNPKEYKTYLLMKYYLLPSYKLHCPTYIITKITKNFTIFIIYLMHNRFSVHSNLVLQISLSHFEKSSIISISSINFLVLKCSRILWIKEANFEADIPTSFFL